MTKEECIKQQLFCSIVDGLSYMARKYHISSPEVVWTKALETLRELEGQERKDILVKLKYGCVNSPEAMTVLAVMFFMIIAKENEGYTTRTDLKDEMVSMLNEYGGEWSELYQKIKESEDKEENKGRFVKEFDYLENRDAKHELDEADIAILRFVIEKLKQCVWVKPASDEKITLWICTLFGRNPQLLDAGDETECEKFRNFFKKGKSRHAERKEVSLANVIGYLMKYELINGTQQQISKDVFKNTEHVNNINKGKDCDASKAFNELVPFMDKYREKIIKE